MAGGAMPSDVPMIQFKAAPSKVTSLPSSSNLNLPVSATYTGPLRTSCPASNCSCHSGTGGRMETIDGREEKRASGSLYNLLFAHVPFQSEVENAFDSSELLLILDLLEPLVRLPIAPATVELVEEWRQLMEEKKKEPVGLCIIFFLHMYHSNRRLKMPSTPLNFMLGKSSSGSESNLLQQKLDCFDPRLFLSHGYRRVCDAFQLLQTDPSVKRLVISLASDKAIWDAILKNELVRKLIDSSYTVDNGRLQSSNEEPDLVTSMLRWILVAIKGKLVELIERFLSLVNDLFKPPEKEKPKKADNEQMVEKVRPSLLLSVVILLIVLVARAQNA